jgi:hypothetical protein
VAAVSRKSKFIIECQGRYFLMKTAALAIKEKVKISPLNPGLNFNIKADIKTSRKPSQAPETKKVAVITDTNARLGFTPKTSKFNV